MRPTDQEPENPDNPDNPDNPGGPGDDPGGTPEPGDDERIHRRFVYEYHLRDHQQNLRLAFRAETARRVLRLTMEDDRAEDGSSYPAFRRVNATRDYSLAYQGRASAAVSASQPGPSTRLPVVGGDVVKVDFFYTTPAGPQHQRAAAPLPTASPAPRSLRLLPVLLPAPGSAGRPGGVDGHSGRAGGVGLQLQLGGLLSGRGRPRPASPVAPYENAETTGGPAPQPTMTRRPTLRWELRDAAGDVVQSDVVEVPTTEAGRDRWQHFSTSIAVDKGPDGKLTGDAERAVAQRGGRNRYTLTRSPSATHSRRWWSRRRTTTTRSG